MKNSSLATGHLVDNYGLLKAQAADAKAEMDSIKAILIERHGEGKHEGEMFRASITNPLRSLVKWEAVAAALAKKAGITDKALDALIAENTNCSSTWTLTCGSRLTK